MNNPLERAMAVTKRDSWLDQIAYASLKAAEAKYFPQSKAPIVELELVGAKANAFDTAAISMAFQTATAKIGHLLAHPDSDNPQNRREYRDAAPLLSRGQMGNVLYFGFPESVVTDPTLFNDRHETLAERAVRDLIEILPESAQDDRAVDAIPSRNIIERSAIEVLVKAVEEADTNLGLSLRSGDEVLVSSEISHSQAGIISNTLRETNVVTTTEIIEGVLDGMRTSRRLFYLERENASDISGAVDESLLNEVRKLIGETVSATLERKQVTSVSGRTGRPSYRLLKIEPVIMLL